MIWDEIGKPLAVLVAIAAVLVAAITIPLMTFDVHNTHVRCLQIHEVTGLQTRVVAKGTDRTCYVEIEPGEWIPEDRWRGVDE